MGIVIISWSFESINNLCSIRLIRFGPRTPYPAFHHPQPMLEPRCSPIPYSTRHIYHNHFQHVILCGLTPQDSDVSFHQRHEPSIQKKGGERPNLWMDQTDLVIPGALVWPYCRCGVMGFWEMQGSWMILSLLAIQMWRPWSSIAEEKLCKGSKEGREKSFWIVAKTVERMYGWMSIFNGFQTLLIGCNFFVLLFLKAK